MQVEIWSDIVCPWCYIGKRRFERAVAALADDDTAPQIDVVYRPFQLDPTAPPGSTMPVVDAYARKFGGYERAQAMIDRVTAIAADEGLEFHLDRALRANTVLAHRLLWWSADGGTPFDQGALKERLLQAYFVNGEKVGDPEALVEMTVELGGDGDATSSFLDSDGGLAEIAALMGDASAAEITAVPTYVLDGAWAIPGAQDPDTFVTVIRRLADRACVPSSHLAAERIGAGPSRLVLVHGFTQTCRSWRPLLPRLAGGHEVISVDAPGHGESRHDEADLPTGAQLLAAAGGTATYIGYSMGGRLALHVAVDHPRLVERLVLVGATPGIEDDDERARRRRADEALATRLEQIGLDPFLREWLGQPLFAGLDPAGADLDDRRRNRVGGLAASLRHAGTGTQEPLWHRLGGITCPVLMLVGERDSKFRAIAERMAALVPDASVAVVEGAGHSVHLERPGRVADILLAWLGSRKLSG